MDYQLIVSNPPHRLDSLDAAACAACFGRSAGEVRTKANTPAPEIWYGDTNSADIDEKISAMRAAGLSVFSVSGSEVARIPPDQADAFYFTDNGIVFETARGQVELTKPQKLFVVSCRPKLPVGNLSPDAFLGALKRGLQTGHRLAGTRRYGAIGGAVRSIAIHAEAAAQKAQERRKQAEKETAARKTNPPYLAFLDIYYGCEGGHGRITLIEGTLNYQPLGADMKTTARENSKVLLEKLREMYGDVYVDTRLENLHYKPGTIAGLHLNKLLELTDPAMKDLDSYELASRLVFLSTPPEHRPEPLPISSTGPDQPAPSGSALAPKKIPHRGFE
jgi:hypothetical protein